MAKDKVENNSGGGQILAGYGQWVFIVLILAIILFSIFCLFFGFNLDLLWTNIVVLAIWLILVSFSFQYRPKGELWRDYRWIVAPALLILLFLFNTSWAQSKLSIEFLEKPQRGEYSILGAKVNVETPDQILYDSNAGPRLSLWLRCQTQCANQIVTLSTNTDKDILFAVQNINIEPLQWHKVLKVTLPHDGSVVTVLINQFTPDKENRTATIILTTDEFHQTIFLDKNKIQMEGSKSAQARTWKKNFLGTGSIVVSLIVAAFAGIKQLEEEERRKRDAKEEDEKRQKENEIKQAIDTFATAATEDSLKTLEDDLKLFQSYSEWERKKTLQSQLSKKITDFLNSNEFWESLLDKNVPELTDIAEKFLKLCKIISVEPEQLRLLNTSLRQDEHDLLTLLKEYPESSDIVKQITRSLPDELKKKIQSEYKNEYLKQIIDLKDELGFVDLEGFPLQNQFNSYAKDHLSDDKLTMWLKDHQLDCSPFADADTPFYFGLGEKLLIDLASPGFTFPAPDFRNSTFSHANSWDAGAALFDYCKALQQNKIIKENVFFVALTPTTVENYGEDRPQKVVLHALAEQWIWSLAETPILFYSLREPQRTLLCRLLRWHDLSPVITASKIAERLQGRLKEKSTKALPVKIKEWLDNSDSNDLRVEEINALIGLRPSPKTLTFFLVSTVDLNPRVEKQVFSKIHGKLDEKSEWLSAYGCTLVHFLIDDKKKQVVPQSSLINQCKIRIQKCSKDKVDAFDLLFAPHDKEPADNILANKSNGSPGKMVRLGQKLLLKHVEKYSPDKDLHIEDLIALE